MASIDTRQVFDEMTELRTLRTTPTFSFIPQPSQVRPPLPANSLPSELSTGIPPPWLREYTSTTTPSSSFTSTVPSPVILRSRDEGSSSYLTATDNTPTLISPGEPEDGFPLPLRRHSEPAFSLSSQLSHVPSLLPLPVNGINGGREGSRLMHHNRTSSDNQLQPQPSTSGIGIDLRFSRVTVFSYEELAKATDEFSDENHLGQGGFGSVHRGTLANGDQVAIKQLKSGSGQGDREFQAEVEIISRVHHKHLVSLVGYCIAEEHRILVYEFVCNNTLKFHLHGSGRPTMEWSTRVKVALGSAKGLAYLHEDCHPKIIHRDIKSDNILLDLYYEAKIADFGLAKIFPDDNTYIEVTRVMGTFGYLDPECFLTRKFTERSDVFSFGVMILELITGRQAIIRTQSSGVYSLVEWARPLMESHNYHLLVDPRLESNYNFNEMTRVVDCAAACLRPSSRSRPKMSQIVRVLEGHLSLNLLNEGITVSRASTFNHIESSSLYSP
ncbi:proline-rich receptor-like protein kinase PERK1 isoform X2 [Tasmannia lanceolata]